MKSIFSRIIAGELPAEKVFENEHVLVIEDIHPMAPIHLLIISKKEIPMLQETSKEEEYIFSEMCKAAKKMAIQFKIEKGYRLVINNGETAGQTIFHLHMHLLGGTQLSDAFA